MFSLVVSGWEAAAPRVRPWWRGGYNSANTLYKLCDSDSGTLVGFDHVIVMIHVTRRVVDNSNFTQISESSLPSSAPLLSLNGLKMLYRRGRISGDRLRKRSV